MARSEASADSVSCGPGSSESVGPERWLVPIGPGVRRCTRSSGLKSRKCLGRGLAVAGEADDGVLRALHLCAELAKPGAELVFGHLSRGRPARRRPQRGNDHLMSVDGHYGAVAGLQEL